jgi:hypothetical protein
MLLSLRVRQVRRLVVVQRQAQLALVRPQVVAHKVGVLLKVDGLGGKGGQALATVPVRLGPGGRPSRTGLGPHAVLEIHLKVAFTTLKCLSRPVAYVAQEQQLLRGVTQSLKSLQVSVSLSECRLQRQREQTLLIAKCLQG